MDQETKNEIQNLTFSMGVIFKGRIEIMQYVLNLIKEKDGFIVYKTIGNQKLKMIRMKEDDKDERSTE